MGKSKILKIVLNDKNSHNLLRCEAYETYAIVILNQFVDEENRYHSRDGWEEKYYGCDEHMIISSRQTSDYLPYPFF